MSKAVGFKLEEIFNSVRKVIIPATERKEGRHVKIIVEIDVTQPLIKGTKIKVKIR